MWHGRGDAAALAAAQQVAKSTIPTLGYGTTYAGGNVLLALRGSVIVAPRGGWPGRAGSGLQHEEVGDADQAQDEADGPGHHLPERVVDDLRVDQANVPAARLDDASPGRLDVLHPLAVAAVGQRAPDVFEGPEFETP